MGEIIHRTLVVIGSNYEDVELVRTKAIAIFEECFYDLPYTKPYGSRLISPILPGLVNSTYTFVIVPDGSKNGFSEAICSSRAIFRLMDWIDEQENNKCFYTCLENDDHGHQCKILRTATSQSNYSNG